MEDVQKFQQMQDEMSRFEAEISSGDRPPLPPPPMSRPVIGANTFNQVQQQLDRVLPPPPPPPMMPQGFCPPGFEEMAMRQRMMFPGMPPGNMMVPPQVRMRPPMDGMPPSMMPRPGMMPGPQAMPGPAAMPPPPKPAVVLSSAPKLYKKEKEVEKKKEDKVKVKPQPMPIQNQTPEAPAVSKPSPLVHAVTTTVTYTPVEQSNNVNKPKKEKKGRKVVRTAGGTVWEDVTLLEWPDDDYRLFAGDLGNDVTDELLTRTFSKYSSFQRAKVIRDKRTNKSKGFGFISFKEPADFIKAMKEMNGRYVGSRPIKLHKSTWKNRSLDVVRKKEKEKAALLALLTSNNRS